MRRVSRSRILRADAEELEGVLCRIHRMPVRQGANDTIEIWRNTVASDIDFSPIFHDDAEEQLYTVSYKTGPLARRPDYFVDFAFPVSTLIAKGVISTAADLSQSFFFPATATNPNNYSNGYLNCPFQPYTALTVDKSVAPAVAPVNAVTPVT